jgi:hypothetical protein
MKSATCIQVLHPGGPKIISCRYKTSPGFSQQQKDDRTRKFVKSSPPREHEEACSASPDYQRSGGLWSLQQQF